MLVLAFVLCRASAAADTSMVLLDGDPLRGRLRRTRPVVTPDRVLRRSLTHAVPRNRGMAGS